MDNNTIKFTGKVVRVKDFKKIFFITLKVEDVRANGAVVTNYPIVKTFTAPKCNEGDQITVTCYLQTGSYTKEGEDKKTYTNDIILESIKMLMEAYR
jgi:hypothetical protein